MTKKVEMILAVMMMISAIMIGCAIRIIQESKKITVLPKGYYVTFRNKKCELCGSNPAVWFEFTAKKGQNEAYRMEYLCTECHQFLRYGEKRKLTDAGN